VDICTQGGVCNSRLEKIAFWGALWFALLVKYYWNGQIKGGEMNGVVTSMGEKRQEPQGFVVGKFGR
jgi:hypothetical protein